MVSIHSARENDFLKSILKEEDVFYWLGGVQVMANSKAYAWIDGTQFDYSNWSPGDPNDHNTNECVGTAINKDGIWIDELCTYNGSQLCQISDSVPFTDEYTPNFISILTQNAVTSLKNISALSIEVKTVNNTLTEEVAKLKRFVMLNNSETILKLEDTIKKVLLASNHNKRLLNDSVKAITQQIHNSTTQMKTWKDDLNSTINQLNKKVENASSRLDNVKEQMANVVNKSVDNLLTLTAKLDKMSLELKDDLRKSQAKVKYVESRLDDIDE
ncbi:lung surfactant protein A-like protein, partial [Leptotrombidium deliense]